MAKIIKIFTGNSRGIGLIEVLIALAILGVVAVAFLSGLSTSLKAVFIADERSTAVALAQSQMEYVKSENYSAISGWAYTVTISTHSYSTDPQWPEDPPPLSSDYSGYCVKAESGQIDGATAEADGIRKITITVYHNEDCAGEEVLTLKDYKVKR